MIENVRLQNFRSYDDASFEFDPGVNIIVGPNASGKTNLLEALLVASTGNSYRVHDAELVAYGRDWARLDAATSEHQRVVKLESGRGSPRPKKTILLDDKPFQRLPLHQTLPVILFEPNHLLLLHGSPDRRREYLDNILEQTVAGFGVSRRQYKRALAQRNALLKQNPAAARQQLFAWNVRLSEIGGQIAARRLDLVERINQAISPTYQTLSRSATDVAAAYQSSCGSTDYSSRLLRKLEAGSDLDFQRGFTAYGPHRDDLVFELAGHPAAEHASRGEIRTLLLALKILELQLVETARGKRPLLLLDDVFSELDGSRRKALTDHLRDYQTFLTTTDADVVVHHFMDQCRIVPL